MINLTFSNNTLTFYSFIKLINLSGLSLLEACIIQEEIGFGCTGIATALGGNRYKLIILELFVDIPSVYLLPSPSYP